jgi:hypothetical protein
MANTENEQSIEFRVMSDSAFEDEYLHNKNTFTVTNKDGTISETTEQASTFYTGGNKLTDIVVLNDIAGYTYEIINGTLSATPVDVSAGSLADNLGNQNKLYIWFDNNNKFNVFVYNKQTKEFLQMGNDTIVENSNNRGVTRATNDNTSPINYVTSEADIGDSSKYQPQTWVYYPQS